MACTHNRVAAAKASLWSNGVDMVSRLQSRHAKACTLNAESQDFGIDDGASFWLRVNVFIEEIRAS
jgi:hypothetical protein